MNKETTACECAMQVVQDTLKQNPNTSPDECAKQAQKAYNGVVGTGERITVNLNPEYVFDCNGTKITTNVKEICQWLKSKDYNKIVSPKEIGQFMAEKYFNERVIYREVNQLYGGTKGYVEDGTERHEFIVTRLS